MDLLKSHYCVCVWCSYFFISLSHARITHVGSGDIINGNVKLILGLIWTLILHYQISIGFGIESGSGKDGKSGKTGKQALLEWLQVGPLLAKSETSMPLGLRRNYNQIAGP